LTDYQIERLADEVVSAFGQSTPPVNIELIAREEGIALGDGDFDDDFHGRIEYLAEVANFVIYHPSIASNQYPSRVRFSIAHELGHYYIPAHREMLMKGCAHNSMEGFNHKDVIERQADTFAAALLIPSSVLKHRMGRRGFLSLPQILALAEDCKASAQATAFRYSKFTKEPHLSFVSEKETVLYCFSSEEARAIGCGSLRNQNVPVSSATSRATRSSRLEEGKIDSELWFPNRSSHAELWEESIRLGTSNRVLTLLSWAD
jgi:hypothetical protein